MTKEELEKEAEDYAREWLYHVKDLELHHKEDDKPKYIRIKEAYLAGAEPREKQIADLEKENAELRKVAEFQQSSNMNRYFENKKLKEGLAVGSTFNKALNSINKNLIEKSDKYRNMVFDKDKQLTKAKEIIKNLMKFAEIDCREYEEAYKEAEQFVKE